MYVCVFSVLKIIQTICLSVYLLYFCSLHLVYITWYDIDLCWVVLLTLLLLFKLNNASDAINTNKSVDSRIHDLTKQPTVKQVKYIWAKLNVNTLITTNKLKLWGSWPGFDSPAEHVVPSRCSGSGSSVRPSLSCRKCILECRWPST